MPSLRPRTAAARRHSTTRMLYCRGAASALAERVRELATTKVTPWGRGTSSVCRCCAGTPHTQQHSFLMWSGVTLSFSPCCACEGLHSSGLDAVIQFQ